MFSPFRVKLIKNTPTFRHKLVKQQNMKKKKILKTVSLKDIIYKGVTFRLTINFSFITRDTRNNVKYF